MLFGQRAAADHREPSPSATDAEFVAPRALKPTSRRQRVLLQIIDPEDSTRHGGETLTEIAGLTPAEAKVVAEIGANPSLAAIAAKLGVSTNTVKTHLNGFLRRQACIHRLNLPDFSPPFRSPSQWSEERANRGVT